MTFKLFDVGVQFRSHPPWRQKALVRFIKSMQIMCTKALWPLKTHISPIPIGVS